MQIGILGLGETGINLLEKLLKEGHEVVAWNRSKDVLDKLKIEKAEFFVNNKLQIAYSIEGLREKLLKPRVFWMLLPAGETTANVLLEILNIAEVGDIIIDGGHAYYKDTQQRYEDITKKGIKYLGIGIAGGLTGPGNGYCFMVGGNKEGYEYIKPALDSLASPGGGHAYLGEGGAGHFSKMVHNGIEYGIMQAIAEGFGMVEKSPYSYNLLEVGSIWQRGSTIRSFLLDMAMNTFINDPDFINRQGYIETTGEVKWDIDQSKEEHVPTDVIEKALEFRQRSQYDEGVQKTFAAKLVSGIRRQLGGHDDKIKDQ